MPTPKVLLGIDLGTTYIKACVFNASSGRALAEAGIRLPIRALDGGGREQDVDSIMAALKWLVRTLRKELPRDYTRISGVGVASQGGSTIIARHDGTPLTPMLLWNDARAAKHVEAILAILPLTFWQSLTLRGVAPHGLARIHWLQQHRPKLFERPEDVLHAGAGDFLFFALTGVWRQDAGSAIQIGPYDATARCMDPRPLRALGLTLHFVPPLRDGHTTCPLSDSGARLLQLEAGLPAAGPYIDQEAGYRSAASTLESPLQISLGTAWVGNFELPRHGVGDAPYQLVLPADSADRRLVVLPLLTGNATWEWALSAFANGVSPKALESANTQLARHPFPHAGLHFLPWNAQENPLLPGALGGGTFSGLTTTSTRVDLLSAAASGLVFELGRVFGLLRDSGVLGNVVLTGGASKSEHLQRLIATLMAPLPVYRQTESDVGGVRGALCAFGCTAPPDALRRVPLPDALFQRTARKRAREYEAIMDALYGHVKAGHKYKLGHA